MHPPRTAPLSDTSERLTIRVDRTEVDSRGQKNRKPWTKYQVFGTRADGSPIVTDGRPIFTFDRLDTGEVEVLLVPFIRNGQTVVESWTVKKPRAQQKAARPAGGAPMDDDRYAELEDRVSTLEGQVARLLAANRRTGVSA